MRNLRGLATVCLSIFCLIGAASGAAQIVSQENSSQRPKRPGVDGDLTVTVGMSMIIDSPEAVVKISIANGDLAEAVAVTPKEILINGKAPGQTSLIVWQQGGARLVYDLTVRIASQKLDAAREQLAHDFPDDGISVVFENDTAFVRGSVKDTYEAARVMAIASTLGKAINLLRVEIPAQEPQILLKVRFADVDRSASQQLGMNLASNAFNTTAGISTDQFGRAGISSSGGSSGAVSLSDALNVLLFSKNLNIGVTIQALENKNQLQMLAEPNVMATNGKSASFLAGGQFPVPSVQAGANTGAVSVTYEPYGIQLHFLPQITPRGTIMLSVTPEVSSLDFANAVTISGTTVPALTTRRIDTAVELEPGQSFVIAGLLDNQTTRTLSKIPGLSDIPLLGKLFQSRAVSKSNTELLVIVTPELVRPIPADQKLPELKFTDSFMEGQLPQQTETDKTGTNPLHPGFTTMPIEQLIQQQQKLQQTGAQPNIVTTPPAAPAANPANPTGAGK